MRIGKNKKNIEQESYKCDECDEIFNLKTTYKNHKKAHARLRRETQKRKFEKMFEDEYDAINAAESTDKMSETHKCNECAKNFKSKAGICVHKNCDDENFQSRIHILTVTVQAGSIQYTVYYQNPLKC